MPLLNLKTGATLFYEDENPSGERTIVILHGLLGTGRKDLGQVIDWLADCGFRVIAPSLRGYGESLPKPRDFPPRFYQRDAEDVLALIEALNLPPVDLLGYSDGGEVALICASESPAQFISVATIGALGYFIPEMRKVVMGYRPGSQWITREEIEMHSISDPDRFSAQWVRAIVQMIDLGGDISKSKAHQITAPLLMMLGVRDVLNPSQAADEYLKSVPNGKLMMFNAGHPVHEEQWADFKAAMRAHLKL